MSRESPLEILLVEDNAGDVRLTIEAFKECDVRHKLNVARDGVEALDYLHRRGKFAAASRPDFILLDLNLPKKDGLEVLAEIKSKPDLRRIPVIVLTTSRNKDDVKKCYDLHANSYVPKPVDIDQFIAVVKAIDSFWCSAAQFAD